MFVEVVDEARDVAERYPVMVIKREGESLVIVTNPLTFVLSDFEEFIESAISLA